MLLQYCCVYFRSNPSLRISTSALLEKRIEQTNHPFIAVVNLSLNIVSSGSRYRFSCTRNQLKDEQ